MTQDMGPGPGQREESQRGATITTRQPEIRLRFDILSSTCPQHPTLHFTIIVWDTETKIILEWTGFSNVVSWS